MRRRSVPQGIGLLAILAAVAGLLVAGLAMPVVAGVTWAAHRQQNALADLPSFLSQPPLAQRSVMYAADGSVIATISGPEDRVVVASWQIPDVMKKAIVAIEDNRFYEHKGVDLRSVLRAAHEDSAAGSYAQGASTITEQYVKLVELEKAGNDKEAQQAATEKSLERKIDDARLAIALEKVETKDQILTNYLNIAYFGEGVYGVGTAATHYFGVPVQQLTLAQAALLAGLVNNPAGFDPVQHPQAALDRRNQVLDAVEKYQFLPAATVQAALKQPIDVHPVMKTVDPCASSTMPVDCAYALQQLYSDPQVGTTRVLTGGLKIYTSFQPTVQKAVDTQLSAHVPDKDRQVEAAVVEQPGTGAIVAIGQNRGYGTGPGQSKSIYAGDYRYDVGSTFKAVTLTAAVEQGIPLTTTISSPACYHLPGQVNPPGGPNTRCHNAFSNAGDSESGSFNLYTGTWASVNTFFVQLEAKVGGPSTVAALAKKMGVIGSSGGPKSFQGGGYGYSLTLGSGGGFSAFDIANVYATLAAHGTACTASAITKITTQDGGAVPFTGSSCKQVLSATTADTVTSILQGVLDKPGATAAGLGIGRPAAGKTGTVDDSNEAWFAGYTPQYVTVVGMFDPFALSSPLTPFCDNKTGSCFHGGNLYGASVPGPTWHDIMAAIHHGLPVENFALPEAVNTGAPATATVPDVAGESVQQAGQDLQNAGFTPRIQTLEVNSTYPPNSVAGTNPPAGASVPSGSTVIILVSNGRAPVQPPPASVTVTVTPTTAFPTPPNGPPGGNKPGPPPPQ
ncbi:MAG TPA: transglycosylase domain-containing protein [Mycobacteriales bacterium]